MAEIHPFRAYRYADKHLKSVNSLVCPPYDIIPDALREALYRKDPRNFIRVEHRKGDPKTKYAEAAKQWKAWLEEGVLCRDVAPAIYVYEAAFTSQSDGRALRRLGATGPGVHSGFTPNQRAASSEPLKARQRNRRYFSEIEDHS